MIADYSAEIKIAIFRLFRNAKVTNEDQIASELRQKLRLLFKSVNSEIIGRKVTKFVHDVGRLLPIKLLKTDLRLVNPLSNAEAKSIDCSWRCLRTSPKFNWLP